MTYFVDIFSVETYEAFSKTKKVAAGFHPDRLPWVRKIKPGDKILCYLKGLSCWVGVLEVKGPLLEAASGPEGLEDYSVLFPTEPLVWLDKGSLVPIKRDDVWGALSFTKSVSPGAGGWNATLRSSGVRLTAEDGAAVESILLKQAKAQVSDGITDDEWQKRRTYKISPKPGVTIDVEIPGPEPSTTHEDETVNGNSHARISHKMQALLADIGVAMGFQVWIPKADKEAVIGEMAQSSELLEALPYTQFSEPAVKTVEQIDVLWLQKKTIVRAFEVEHTTAVYSGLLRMADLLALQPNFHTKLHIVAPAERRKKVFQELRRPAFSIFPQGPLSELCSYLPYEQVQALAGNPLLEHLKQDVLDKFEEFANEAE